MGLNASTLSYWKWRLGSERRASAKSKHARPSASKRRSSRAATMPEFIEVTPLAAPQREPLALELPGAITVRVPAGFDEDTLVRVLRVVRSTT
jgi:hypothetical protein